MTNPRTTWRFDRSRRAVACAFLAWGSASCADAGHVGAVGPLVPARPTVVLSSPVDAAAPSIVAEESAGYDDASAPDAEGARTFDVRTLSAHHDFRVVIAPGRAKDAGDGDGVRTATVVVLGKGTETEEQRLPFVLELEDGELPRELEDGGTESGILKVGDFNFDGHEDFAVVDTHHGPYGAYTSDVFLFDPSKKLFVASPELTELEHESLAVDYDAKRRRVVVSNKTGAWYHETDEYVFEHGALEMVSTYTEEWTPGDRVIETRSRIEGKRWRTTKTERAATP